MDLFAEVVALTAAFETANIEYAICGGIALAIHGAPRATKDIDVLARRVDLPRVRDAARSCGFTIEALPMTFSSSGITIQRFTKIAPGGATLVLDVLLADPQLDAVWETRIRVDVTMAGTMRSLSVVSRDGLVTLKLAANRPQDLVDVQHLQEVARGEDDS